MLGGIVLTGDDLHAGRKFHRLSPGCVQTETLFDIHKDFSSSLRQKSSGEAVQTADWKNAVYTVPGQ